MKNPLRIFGSGFNNKLTKYYLLTLYISLLAGLQFPDTDFFLIFILGHRSIITHGIIVPYFLYRYLTKEEKKNIFSKYFSKILPSNIIKNDFLNYAYIGFLIGIAIHLCADLFPKAYIGFALIKLPFNISLGTPLSIIWMFANMFFAVKIAFKKITEKDIEIKIKNRIFFSIILIGIIYLILDTMFVSKIILMLISFPIIWVYSKKAYKVIKK